MVCLCTVTGNIRTARGLAAHGSAGRGGLGRGGLRLAGDLIIRVIQRSEVVSHGGWLGDSRGRLTIQAGVLEALLLCQGAGCRSETKRSVLPAEKAGSQQSHRVTGVEQCTASHEAAATQTGRVDENKKSV